MYKIVNNSNNFPQINDFERICNDFLPHAQKYLGFDKPVAIELVSDPENAKNPFGKTAYYDPGAMKITLFIDKRHVKDILRSLSHELVHHSQNCKGEFSGGINTGPGYAQEDPHMRKCESEAYLHGNGLMWRDFEDGYKQKNLNLENINSKINYLLERYEKETLVMQDQEMQENEGKARDESQPRTEVMCKKFGGQWDPAEEKCSGAALNGSTLEEDESGDDGEEVNENWFKGNKDQLLFDRLVEKWIK